MNRLLFTCASLTATAAALRPMPASILRAPLSRHVLRTSRLLAQSSWSTRHTPDGATYYYNERTGQSQWEPPPSMAAPQGFGAPVLWHMVPTNGVCSSYTLGNGQTQVLGRWDMAQTKDTVSREQCGVEVAADGTATLVSLGRRPTGLRRHGQGAPWYGLDYYSRHVLLDGEQIALDMDSGESFGWQGQPYTAIFQVQLEWAGAGGGGQQQQGGYQQQPGQYGYR